MSIDILLIKTTNCAKQFTSIVCEPFEKNVSSLWWSELAGLMQDVE